MGSEEASEEREAVLKGLVALIGIYFFFLAEKMVSTISEYRAEKAAERVSASSYKSLIFHV